MLEKHRIYRGRTGAGWVRLWPGGVFLALQPSWLQSFGVLEAGSFAAPIMTDGLKESEKVLEGRLCALGFGGKPRWRCVVLLASHPLRHVWAIFGMLHDP